MFGFRIFFFTTNLCKFSNMDTLYDTTESFSKDLYTIKIPSVICIQCFDEKAKVKELKILYPFISFYIKKSPLSNIVPKNVIMYDAAKNIQTVIS